METEESNAENQAKQPSLLHSFGIIVLLLVSITIFNASLRTLLGTSPGFRSEAKIVDLIYDPDFATNFTNVCLEENSLFTLKWNTTICFNKTMYSWYVPWIKAWAWQHYGIVTAGRRRLKELALKALEEAETKSVPEIKPNVAEKPNETAPVQKEPEEQSSTVYTILTAMTLMLAIIALLELFREKFGKKPLEDPKELDRRCSLADFTIKRHERKESQQENLHRQAAFDDTKKVMALQHQGSLDRAISNLTPAVKPSAKLPRQRSMPCRNPSLSSLLERPSLQTQRNVSIDLPEEDPAVQASPLMRRKSRHFIRRH